mmetsp:Transcript_24238/g.33244  ORF Transcript_24238/g.33244 Transcript_24238/m.33244 type:complete len:118 (-) Transcript_24238:1938-2291(-)|eukprot:CAMPEP_0170079424 /NCGR_PEP_ID=MMETSP0019_2-20121128/15803_1 /TAXON_ID=98059 /ORGANISM="Dinobryon sp., Strain UTEXLB2267" /LENGTH=117 /DNA_ID=CAMNT_0010292863 /DNA_START=532 /DNA_END=885 /DNA_ORIENTATION=-
MTASYAPQLSIILNTSGELLDTDFDKHNIRNDDNIGSKDNLVLSRRRMVLLTNINIVQKEEEKRQTKLKNDVLNVEKKKARKAKSEANKARKQARTCNKSSTLLSCLPMYNDESFSE